MPLVILTSTTFVYMDVNQNHFKIKANQRGQRGQRDYGCGNQIKSKGVKGIIGVINECVCVCVCSYAGVHVHVCVYS